MNLCETEATMTEPIMMRVRKYFRGFKQIHKEIVKDPREQEEKYEVNKA